MISDQEHHKIVEAANKGLISVGIERSFARKLFTEVPLSELEKKTGELLHSKKIISLFAFVGSPLLVLFSCILFIKAFGWWAVLGIPVFFLGWYFYISTSVRGGARLNIISYITVAALSTFLLNPPSIWETKFVFLLPYILGLWLERFLYCYTTHQLRILVIRNKKAFEAFQPSIFLTEIPSK